MKIIYEGKTKDVLELDEESVVLKFKDDMTGKDGVFDPGANEVGLSVEGMGKTNLLVTKFFLDELHREGIKTHYLDMDEEANTMTVKKCTPFSKGIEVIYRAKAVGSFIRRYGLYAEEGMELKDYVEITLKDDVREDPLITKDGLVALDILSEDEYEKIKSLTIKISNLIKDVLSKYSLELIDIKLEFGKTVDDEIVLMDELSPGNMRVYKNGEKVEPFELGDILLG